MSATQEPAFLLRHGRLEASRRLQYLYSAL
jgi:hypothetical protein